jgi:hypothetical protein
MIDLIELVQSMAATLGAIPPLMAILAPANSIVAYIDMHPTENSLSQARYEMQPGSVMLAFMETTFQEGATSPWAHTVAIFVKAQAAQSELAIVTQIVNGIPVPGDGLPWRYCPVMHDVLPTVIKAITRVDDEEGLDYIQITTETLETSDYLPATAQAKTAEETTKNGNAMESAAAAPAGASTAG